MTKNKFKESDVCRVNCKESTYHKSLVVLQEYHKKQKLWKCYSPYEDVTCFFSEDNLIFNQ